MDNAISTIKKTLEIIENFNRPLSAQDIERLLKSPNANPIKSALMLAQQEQALIKQQELHNLIMRMLLLLRTAKNYKDQHRQLLDEQPDALGVDEIKHLLGTLQKNTDEIQDLFETLNKLLQELQQAYEGLMQFKQQLDEIHVLEQRCSTRIQDLANDLAEAPMMREFLDTYTDFVVQPRYRQEVAALRDSSKPQRLSPQLQQYPTVANYFEFIHTHRMQGDVADYLLHINHHGAPEHVLQELNLKLSVDSTVQNMQIQNTRFEQKKQNIINNTPGFCEAIQRIKSLEQQVADVSHQLNHHGNSPYDNTLLQSVNAYRNEVAAISWENRTRYTPEEVMTKAKQQRQNPQPKKMDDKKHFDASNVHLKTKPGEEDKVLDRPDDDNPTPGMGF